MTTLELAEKIAVAVLEAAYDSGHGFMWEHAHEHGKAVLKTLHEHNSWFCRLTITEDAHGQHVDTIEASYELVQQELFQ